MIKIGIQFFGGRGGGGSGGSRGGRAGGGGGGSSGGPSKADMTRQASEGATAKERAVGLAYAMGGSGWYAKENIVAKAEDLGGDYMTEVRINTSRKGYFRTEFIYPDGFSTKETYDSVAAVTQAANSFFNRQRKKG